MKPQELAAELAEKRGRFSILKFPRSSAVPAKRPADGDVGAPRRLPGESDQDGIEEVKDKGGGSSFDGGVIFLL